MCRCLGYTSLGFVSLHTTKIKKKILSLFHVHVCACVYSVFIMDVQVPSKGRRERWIRWDWSYRCL